MKDDGRHWPHDPKFKPLMTGPRNGPSDYECSAMLETGLPVNLDQELRTMAGYREGSVTAGRELAIIAKGILWLAILITRSRGS